MRSSTGPAPHPAVTLTADDAALARRVATELSVPRERPADSFVLHAPLELLARAILLPLVAEQDREAARHHLAAVGRRFEASGPPLEVGPPPAASDFGSLAEAADRLRAALAAGDLDDVDRVGWWLADAVDGAGPGGTQDLRAALAGPALTSLAAAGHAPILLHLFPRVAAGGAVTARPVRGLLREMARHPDFRLRWIDTTPAPPGATPAALDEVLSRTVDRGAGGSDFIQPTMDRVDATGVAASLLGPVTGPAGPVEGRVVLRVAARSMLIDQPAAAPYGWTHCLTLPQAVLSLGDLGEPARALRVASTEVLGFRASLGAHPVPAALLDPGGSAVPEDPDLRLDEALRTGRLAAAGAVWHTTADHGVVAGALASAASRHRDAHLVKYTVACLDAARSDPEAARLYLSAAASLVGWWAEADQEVAT